MSVASLAYGVGDGIVRWLRALRPRTEIIIVVLVAFGSAIGSSLLVAFGPARAYLAVRPLIFETMLWQTVLYELVILGVLGSFLGLRGWTLRHVGLAPFGVSSALAGPGLALLAYMAYGATWLAAAPVLPHAAARASTLVAPGLSWAAVALLSTINPLFEEVFVAGYLVTALKRQCNTRLAVAVSVAIRVSYHLYQGALGVVTALPMGLVFTLAFACTGRLWPLVIAHALLDFIGLVSYIAR